MNNNAEDQDFKDMLREAYQGPSPNPEFVQLLGERLKHELTDTSAALSKRPAEPPVRTSRPARPWQWIAGMAAAAAVVLLAVGVPIMRQPGDAGRSQGDRKIAQADIGREKKGAPGQPQVFFQKFQQPAVAPERPPLIKEPTYQSKTPKYAVLAFGPKADTRVWMVLDLAYDPLRENPGNKDSLYIDLNGNGDLTDPGERIPVEVITSTHFDWIARRTMEMHLPKFNAGDIVIRDGKAQYTGLTVNVGWFVGGQRYRWVALKVNVPGRGTQSVSSPLLRFADTPADAPVIHFDGPLTLRLNMSTGILHHPVDYTGKQEAAPPLYEEAPLVRGKECDLTVEIGTPGVGPGTFALMTANIPPSDTHPVAEVEFRHRDPAKPAIPVKVELTQRCCGTLFKGKIRVPVYAAAGKAKVSLSFPGWADGNVSSTDAEVTVVDPPNADASAVDATGKANLSRGEQEKAAAEKVVAELTSQDSAKLSSDEFIKLAHAYNELDDHTRALDAINRIPESYLAEKGQLVSKAILLTNVSSSLGADKVNLLKELAFLDRCIDRRYGNPGLWYWRKAKLLCGNSVSSLPNVEPSIVDREQFEHAYETLKRAFEVEPNLLALDSVRADRSCSPQDFPILSSEPRFTKLMGTKGNPAGK